MIKIKDISGWTMFVFGAIALILGLLGLLHPELLLSILGFAVLSFIVLQWLFYKMVAGRFIAA